MEKTCNNLFWLDLTNQTLEEKTLGEMPNNAIIIAYTGLLQSKIFDHLMLVKTKFPPVVEGENARGLCESYGRPYLYGGRKNDDLQHYDVHVEHLNAQKLHIAASRCLKKKLDTDIHLLAVYMEQSIELKLQSYHVSRRQAYLKTPDAIEYVLEKINTMLKASDYSSSQTTETFEEDDERLVMINKLKETVVDLISTFKARLLLRKDHEFQNINEASILTDDKTCIQEDTQVSPAVPIVTLSSDKNADLQPEEAQRTKVESQEHAAIEGVNNPKQPININTGFMLGCCTFSVGVCIGFITNRQYQNKLSANPKDFALFCGFAVGAGLIVRGSSLIAHSLFPQQDTNNKPPVIAQKPKQDLTADSNLSCK